MGEANPYGGDPSYALWPYPERASGGRLAEILGMTASEYLGAFHRVNLCRVSWRVAEAREAARAMLEASGGRDLVLLGTKVSRAFGFRSFSPFSTTTISRDGGAPVQLVVLPHPSGLNRMWNDPGARDRARAMVEALLASA